MTTSLAVDAQGITKCFGEIRAVDDISVRVAPGEVYGVLGPNGAGKTTFLRMLFGLIRPDSGTCGSSTAPGSVTGSECSRVSPGSSSRRVSTHT